MLKGLAAVSSKPLLDPHQIAPLNIPKDKILHSMEWKPPTQIFIQDAWYRHTLSIRHSPIHTDLLFIAVNYTTGGLDSAVAMATDTVWTIRGSKLYNGEIFHTRTNRPLTFFLRPPVKKVKLSELEPPTSIKHRYLLNCKAAPVHHFGPSRPVPGDKAAQTWRLLTSVWFRS
jgi:hypothetical protein